MRVLLMFRDRNFDLEELRPPNEGTLVEDLGLSALFDAMAGGDGRVREVSRSAVLTGVASREEILYRQAVLADCLAHPATVRHMLEIVADAIAGDAQIYRSSTSKAKTVLRASVERFDLYLPLLKRLETIATEDGPSFRSDGFSRLFLMLARELGDAYLASAQEQLQRLKFKHGALISAKLGDGNKGTDYILRKRDFDQGNWIQRLSTRAPRSFTYRIAPNDIEAARALNELRTRGIASVASAASEAADHILDFLRMLRTELAFYVGCLNLHDHLVDKGEPVCYPVPENPDSVRLCFAGLYDACSALTLDGPMIGNDLRADDRSLVMITGANQGGKSTLLRSVGIAQLMMQCGMFAPATSFQASISTRIFTHWKREEDETLSSGKLDEELARMSAIIDRLTPTSLLLFNESFAATTEREGAEIARQIIRALHEFGARMVFVTHQYDLAARLYREDRDWGIFLRAERETGGRRTFKLLERPPLPTSYGQDLYDQILGDEG